jgi:hypothetical protein
VASDERAKFLSQPAAEATVDGRFRVDARADGPEVRNRADRPDRTGRDSRPAIARRPVLASAEDADQVLGAVPEKGLH